MKFRLLAVAGVASLFLLAPATADASCCDHQAKAPCCDMPCCADKTGGADINIVESMLTTDPQLNPAPPVRQVFDVWLKRPTMVGRSVMQGRFVVEHDNDRMARGEPCTHIYAYDDYSKGDRSHPYATFHCTHLERERANTNIVMLESLGDGWHRLTEFQFAGETASHGYPTVR